MPIGGTAREAKRGGTHLDDTATNDAYVIKHNYEDPITEEVPPKLYNLSSDIVEEPGEQRRGLLGMDVVKWRRVILDTVHKRPILSEDGEVEIKLPEKPLAVEQHESLLMCRGRPPEIPHGGTTKVAEWQPD